MDFLPLDICKKLQGKTNLKSLFVYNKEQIINPEIIEKHGDLTDDGYYELTKECGGPYKFNEVYIYDYKLMLKRDVWVGKETVYAYTIDCVLKWLREEKEIDIVIYPIDRNTIYMGGEKYILSIYCCGKRDYKIHESNNDKFVKWEDACIYGIEYLMNNNLI